MHQLFVFFTKNDTKLELPSAYDKFSEVSMKHTTEAGI